MREQEALKPASECKKVSTNPEHRMKARHPMQTIAKASALIVAGLLAASSLTAATNDTGQAVTPAKKPKLFVLGDSISIQYGLFLQKMVASRFEYSRKTGFEPQLKGTRAWGLGGDNGKHSNDGRVYIEGMLKDPNWRPDVMLLNAGIHDLTTMDPVTKVKQVPLDVYIQNLTIMLDALAKRKIQVIWVNTTPVNEAYCREQNIEVKHYSADVEAYNAAAAELMAKKGVPVLDLCSFTSSLGGKEIFYDMCHFTGPVARLQAAHIAGYLAAWREAK
jgi:lysophospholipase L1-like esterase